LWRLTFRESVIRKFQPLLMRFFYDLNSFLCLFFLKFEPLIIWCCLSWCAGVGHYFSTIFLDQRKEPSGQQNIENSFISHFTISCIHCLLKLTFPQTIVWICMNLLSVSLNVVLFDSLWSVLYLQYLTDFFSICTLTIILTVKTLLLAICYWGSDVRYSDSKRDEQEYENAFHYLLMICSR